MQAADDREAEVRRSLRDTELKHKQQIKHLDASVQELKRYHHLARVPEWFYHSQFGRVLV